MRRYAVSVLAYEVKPVYVNSSSNALDALQSEINHIENILHDVVTPGPEDSEIQLDLLGEKNHDMTLEEVFQFTEAKEAGTRSARHLLESQGADATHSQYLHGKQEDLKNNKIHNKNETCSYCGKQGHGKNFPTKTRKNACPHMGRLVLTAVVPTTSRLYNAARPRQPS